MVFFHSVDIHNLKDLLVILKVLLIIFINNKNNRFTFFGNLGCSINQACKCILCEFFGFYFIQEHNHFSLVLDRNRWDFIYNESLTIKSQSKWLNQNRWGTLIEFVFTWVFLIFKNLLKIIKFWNSINIWFIRKLVILPHIFKWKFMSWAIIALWLCWMRITFTGLCLQNLLFFQTFFQFTYTAWVCTI